MDDFKYLSHVQIGKDPDRKQWKTRQFNAKQPKIALNCQTNWTVCGLNKPSPKIFEKYITHALESLSWYMSKITRTQKSVRYSTWMSALPMHSMKSQKALMQVTQWCREPYIHTPLSCGSKFWLAQPRHLRLFGLRIS